MSNLPKIYGTCKAGCLWETVHKSDFERCASVVAVPQSTDGKFYLEINKPYKIHSEQEWNGKIEVRSDFDSGIYENYEFPVTFDIYKRFIKFRCCYAGLDDSRDNYKVVYEINDERIEFEQELTFENISMNILQTYLTVEGASAVYLYNDDVQLVVVGEKGEKGEDANTDEIYAAVNDKYLRNSKRISNLEQRIDPTLFFTDMGTAYIKYPSRYALPYAEITKVGGMSYVVEGTLRHAKPTAFKSIGANRFNPQWLLDAFSTVTVIDGFYYGNCAWYYEKYGMDGRSLPFVGGFKENTAYTIQFEGYNKNLSVATVGLQYFYTDGTSDYSPFISSTTNAKYSKVTDSNKTLHKITMTYYDSDYVYFRNICIIEGDVAEYVPYKESTLPIPTEVQGIDGYGYGVNANAYNYVEWKPDEAIKKYHKACGVVDLGTLDWDNTSGFMTSYTGLVNAKANNNEAAKILCANYSNTSYNGLTLNTNKHIAIRESDKSVWVMDTDYTSAATFKAAMQGVMLVYELATPEVTDISDILPDDNFIQVEAGGKITAVNEYGYDVPSEITYQLEVEE